ncbi:MAG: PVC-type heme-binding CxxCH protein [Planctomycetota bacterium]
MRILRIAVLFGLVSIQTLVAQRGDRPGEQQQMLPDDVAVPPATPRSPEQERQTFVLPKGYEAQLFASEPLVQDPVVAHFDAAGRMWVCEFRSYMLDIDATDEAEPTGRVVVLHDDDGDGQADRSTVFAKDLVLPRAVLPLPDGALVITPPNLVFLPDADGDLVADGPQQVIMGGFEAGTGNPEHSGNGLLWGLDHRIHLANDKRMVVRRRDGSFAVERGAGGGQWGICHDDRGRFYFNYNSDWLRCDLLPGRFAEAAAKIGGLTGLNHRLLRDTSVWPCRVSPGVNRGYQKGLLRDWTLARHTAVCSPLVYRGDALPFDGDVFVCEPAGNVVRRIQLREHDGAMHGANAYQAEKIEFLQSHDERFRPVHLSNGPDGALYVVDMYRGVIQHRNYVTSFLRDQVKKRGLEQPVHKGRIWRIVATSAPQRSPMPALVAAEPAELVAALRHASGTVRDLALQQIVQRNLQAATPLLRALAADANTSAKSDVAALSALVGLGALSAMDLRRELRGADAGTVAFALQHAGEALGAADPHLWSALDRFDEATPPAVYWHAALAMGEALRSDSPRRSRIVDRAYETLARWLAQRPEDSRLLAASAVAVHPNIPRLLALLADSHTPSANAKKLAAAIGELSRRAFKSRSATVQTEVLQLAAAAATPESIRTAVLAGAVRALPKRSRRLGWLVFPAPPPALTSLSTDDNEAVRNDALALLSSVRVDGDAVPGVVADLTAAEIERVQRGSMVFRSACAACHQLDGRGQRGLAPPLAESEWVSGPSDRLVRIALHGVRGPIEVNGELWDLEMPAQAHMNDKQLAEVLSYLRRSFGHQASCVDEAEVRTMRGRTKRRASAWTAAELLGKE